MRYKRKQIIIVGDRVLIQPDTGEKKSAAGLYLPPSVIEKQDVHGGIVVEVGPGIPVGNPDDISEEPWKTNSNGDIRYIPTQAEIGDYALFLSKASIEIKVEDQDYLILHQSAILVLIRDDLNSLTK
ncbi:MAG TPA: co-chaperone GroES [Candidatus Marinimicrobia bacterium]|jgi:co-chaperonin GroES (HSP10)|nr:co-chaperone GroES [Candidatus Neomarinimicrobiota bacterium]HIM26440.1 co-chaperone GroES [Candidatus Neomarinimicrobiota bacterium]|tara:strand:+ start:1873 stop:2253 length:381 start_codon:yes stop_codon:yes gene_type:complete